MKQFLILALAASLCGQGAALAARAAGQQPNAPQSAGRQPQAPQSAGQQPQPTPQRRPLPPVAATPNPAELGIEIAPEPRLIVMMAALDAAGWDPTPAGEKPSVFRELIRRDSASITPELRRNLQSFYQRNLLKDVADDPATPDDETIRHTPAEQAARYVSLAYALGPAPRFEAPPRSDDLPVDVLEVLDFVPLLREFHRQIGFDDKLPGYLSMYRAEGDKLRRPAAEMGHTVLQYLNTRPETVIIERVKAPVSEEDKKRKKGNERPVTTIRERDRRFVIVPELLAAAGAINFRNVGDDYFAVVPPGIDPRASELRRAYLQYVIDPLVIRFGRDVSAKREAIKQLLDAERVRKGRYITPDAFLAVARSMVAAADARMDESLRLRALQIETSEALKRATDQAARDAALKTAGERERSIRDAAMAQLAEAYERGAILSFYFAEQFRGLEGSGFDISNFVPAMIGDINPERELRRPADYAEAVMRVRELRRRAREARATEAAAAEPANPKRAALTADLTAVEALLRVNNYEEAERRLLSLRAEHPQEPRVYFALGQAASVAASAAFDEGLQEQRLNAALAHYRQSLLFASPEADRSVIARAHLASGRILAHFDRREEALKEFEAAMAVVEAGDRVYQEAAAEKRKLTGQP
jgi:tetratricopeptide (TPR) repeat protein